MSSAKYLGVIFDDDLSWRFHIQHLASQTAKAVSRLWRHGGALSITARRIWYVAMIQAKMCYAANAFFPSLSAAGLTRLERSAKSVVRAILRLQNPIATQPLRKRLTLSTIERFFQRKLLMFAFRCLHSLSSHLFSSFFTPTALSQEDHDRRATRGQVTWLLRVPFFPGPAGRSSIRFQGAIPWNKLPAEVRCTLKYITRG